MSYDYPLVSNSQVINCEDRLRNDLYCVGWGVKLYLVQSYDYPMSSVTRRKSRVRLCKLHYRLNLKGATRNYWNANYITTQCDVTSRFRAL